jgi:GT2 family glycosyltransferase
MMVIFLFVYALSVALLTEAIEINHFDHRKTLTCVSTYQSGLSQTNFTDILNEFVASWMHTTHTSHLLIVDDGSNSTSHINYIKRIEDRHPLRVFTILKDVNGGISKAKNSCIRYFLANEMYSYLILADHDLVFKREDWLNAYIGAHLASNISQFCWWGGNSPKCHTEWNNFTLCSSAVTNGAFIFLTREVINTVGGFHIFPGKYGHEHGEFCVRVIKAGFAPYYADIVNSHDYIDLGSQESEFSASDKLKSASENWQYLGKIPNEIKAPVIE